MKITNIAGIYETLHNNKQAFHAFLFNFRNYRNYPEVINIQRREAELNITLPIGEFLFYHMPPTTNKTGKIMANKTKKISVTTQVFFAKITYFTATPNH